MPKIDEEYERAYSSFVDLVLEITNGSYVEKRDAADKLWKMANGGVLIEECRTLENANTELAQDYDNLQEDVRTAVEEIEDLCDGRKTIQVKKVLSIVHNFLM